MYHNYGMPYYTNPMMMNHMTPEPPACPGGFIYTVQPGDTMFRIANRYGISLQALIQANPQVPNPSVLVVGQRLCVPTGAPLPPPPPGVFCPEGTIYVVMPGDTLFLISRRVGVSLQRLIEANPQIADPNVLEVGQRICIPGVVTPPPPPVVCPEGTIYIAQPGDTMFIISRRFGVSLQRLIDANPQIPDPSVIQVGQRICVPTPDAPLPPGICRVMLTVQPNIPALGGVAFVNLEDPTIWITTFGLPKLPELGKEYCGYYAWVGNKNTSTYFRVDLKDCGVPNILAGYGKTKGAWSIDDEILVTAEKATHPKAPSGLVVLKGTLATCK